MKLLPLSEAEANELHEAGLRILTEVGVRVGSRLAMEILHGAGCDIEGDVARLPADVVQATLAKCPRHFAISGRDGRSVTIGDGALHAHPGGGCRNVIDRRTGRARPATMADLTELIRVIEALPHFDIAIPPVTPADVAPGSMMVHSFAAAIRNSTKPISSPGLHYPAEVRYVAEIARVVRPDAHPLAVISPISPLSYPGDVCEAMLEAAARAMPVNVLPCPIAGATGPITPAGAIAQQHAESLAGIVLIQAARPGAPVVYCSRATVINFRTGESVVGNPEMGLMSACCVQLARRLGLPSNVYGLGTSSPETDVQAGFEKAINVLVPALAGADVVSGGGSLCDVVTCSHAQLVIDDEMLAAVKRAIAGVTVSPETVAIGTIKDAIAGEMFLSHKHTVAHLRDGEIWVPALAVRNEDDTILRRARARADKLLEEQVARPLPDGIEAEIQSILSEADRELSATGTA